MSSTSAGNWQQMDDPYSTPIHGCSGCATTGGRRACPHHGPQAHSEAGVGTVMALSDAMESQRLCRLGFHAWVPWLTIANGRSSLTWCARVGCDASEQFDG